MKIQHRAFLLALLAVEAGAVEEEKEELKLGLINGGSSFFEPVLRGFHEECRSLGVTCVSTTAPVVSDACNEHRRKYVEEWMSQGVTGIAMKPCSDENAMKELFEYAAKGGVTITTLDSDIPDSKRAAYVGTDNEEMGKELAQVLQELKPGGGTYAFVGRKEPRDAGFYKAMMEYNEAHNTEKPWLELHGSDDTYFHPYPGDSNLYRNPRNNNYMPLLRKVLVQQPTAIVILKQTPMHHEEFAAFAAECQARGVVIVGTDTSAEQLQLMEKGLVQGLVAQYTEETGVESARLLYKLAKQTEQEKEVIYRHVKAFETLRAETN